MINLKSYLSERLNQELPGKVAHQEVAPYRNLKYTESDVANAKKSGVLVLFYKKDDEPHLVLIQRTKYDGTHSGQIAFPGGKQEEFDDDIFQTALREANEEVGIIINEVEIIGQLSDVYIPVSNFHVFPIVGLLNHTPKFILDPREVAGIIELKIASLIAVNELNKEKITLNTGLKVEVPTFNFDNKIVWGATALMLNELRYVLQDYH